MIIHRTHLNNSSLGNQACSDTLQTRDRILRPCAAYYKRTSLCRGGRKTSRDILDRKKEDVIRLMITKR